MYITTSYIYNEFAAISYLQTGFTYWLNVDLMGFPEVVFKYNFKPSVY